MAEDGIPGLADKLNRLFATVPGPGRNGLYSNDTAAQALREKGITVSGVHISHLRSGRRNNPSARLLAAIADLFGVPMGYFFNPDLEKQVESELNALTAMKDSRAKGLLLRTQGMSPESMEHLSEIMDRIRKIEGLDDPGTAES
ncbi:helix-turn-helix transcriptional regulator [Microlunatus elymi]|uniref:Helix-turn-helix transcriptional regulator n=1 Tax=Microlunatus elymi TaxID=2596828 RepID=A0A516PW00_9ACTN|nr:helix-turn-helix domain-containing protein [Microlunatus elymi]QDP95353.1 helix-turn-helix transcriptional regulator [Microlunatus elymi]